LPLTVCPAPPSHFPPAPFGFRATNTLFFCLLGHLSTLSYALTIEYVFLHMSCRLRGTVLTARRLLFPLIAHSPFQRSPSALLPERASFSSGPTLSVLDVLGGPGNAARRGRRLGIPACPGLFPFWWRVSTIAAILLFFLGAMGTFQHRLPYPEPSLSRA